MSPSSRAITKGRTTIVFSTPTALTGLNEAFVIDEATKDKLVAEDPKSVEVIKLFPKGRDVRRYEIPKADKFLILFSNGWTRENSGSASDKWSWSEDNYPAIARHLKPFKAAAKKRTDKGEYWWELRPCAYYDKFEEPKIIYPSVSQRGDFTFDDNGVYFDKTCYFVAKNDKYLLGLLNSKTLFFFFGSIGVERRGSYFEYLSQYLKQLPICTINFSDPADKQNHDAVVELVETILSLHEQKAATADPSERAHLEREIAATDA